MKIAILTSGILPVPAVEGGAVENLMDYYLSYNERKKLNDITVYSVWNKKSKPSQNIKKYTNTHFVYFNTNSYWYKIKRKIFALIHKERLYYHSHIEYYLFNTLKSMKQQCFDVVILENRPGYVPEVAKNCPSSRIILHLHNDLLNISTLNASYIKQCLSSTICVSRYIKERVDAALPLTPSYVCYNGIDLEQFQKDCSIVTIREQLGFKQSDFILIFSGRLIPEKGVKELLEAFALLKNKNIKLLIVGGNFFGNDHQKTDYIKELQNIAQQYTDRITFTGYIPYQKMSSILKCADISVIPSLWEEPLSLSCIEAMAAGLPLIITRSGGMPELVNNECAIIVDKTTKLPQKLAEAIDFLYNSPQKREQMSIHSLKRSQLYSKEIYAETFFNLIYQSKISLPFSK